MPNIGDEIMKQYMHRRRWFVPGSSLNKVARVIAKREGFVDSSGKPDIGVATQIRNSIEEYVRHGQIRICKKGGSVGCRKASPNEVQTFKRRGIPSRKMPVRRQQATSRKYAVTTALAT